MWRASRDVFRLLMISGDRSDKHTIPLMSFLPACVCTIIFAYCATSTQSASNTVEYMCSLNISCVTLKERQNTNSCINCTKSRFNLMVHKLVVIVSSYVLKLWCWNSAVSDIMELVNIRKPRKFETKLLDTKHTNVSFKYIHYTCSTVVLIPLTK